MENRPRAASVAEENALDDASEATESLNNVDLQSKTSEASFGDAGADGMGEKNRQMSRMMSSVYCAAAPPKLRASEQHFVETPVPAAMSYDRLRKSYRILDVFCY